MQRYAASNGGAGGHQHPARAWLGCGPAKLALDFELSRRGRHFIGMNRRIFLALPLLLAPLAAHAQTAAPLTAQDRADLARIQAYLNNLHTLKARFLQVSPEGQVSQGTAWLERPGRMRFEYDKPSPYLLVAGYGLVVFHDAQLQQTSNFPLSSTPLSILLRQNVTLTGDVTVTAISRQPGEIQVTMLRTASPGDGTLTLIFADNPLALRQWEVVDGQHRETRVTLADVQLGGTFNPDLFRFIDPRLLGPNGGGSGNGGGGPNGG
jgi:outer membrane lipoprotein-sorting protein